MTYGIESVAMIHDEKDDSPLTYSVVEAGKMAGLSRNAAYEAVKRGEIPLITFGSRIRVLGKPWRAKLNGGSA